MSTEKQKQAARRNIKKAQEARAHGESGDPSQGLTEAERNRMRDGTFAFPDERKEPLNDAAHVRNAIARFDQVEDVSDEERDRDLVVGNPPLANHDDLALGHLVVVRHRDVEVADVSRHAERSLRERAIGAN